MRAWLASAALAAMVAAPFVDTAAAKVVLALDKLSLS